MNNKQKQISSWQTFRRSFYISYCANKRVFILSIVSGLFHGLLYVLYTVSMQIFFDNINAFGIVSDKKQVYFSFALLAFVLLARELFNGLHNYFGTIMRIHGEGYNMSLIHTTVAYFKAQDFENPIFLNNINKAKQGSIECFNFVDTFLDLFDFYVPYFIFMSFYLYSIAPVLLLTVILIFLPVVINTFIKSGMFYQLEETLSPMRRKTEAFRSCICDNLYFKETRFWGGLAYFTTKYIHAVDRLNNEKNRVERKTSAIELLMRVITLLGYCAVLFLLVMTLLKGTISVGEFAAIFSSLSIFFIMMELAVYRNLGDAFKNVGTVKNFIGFIKRPEREEGESLDERIYSITFKNVSFSYDGKSDVLKNISFDLRNKSCIAIVGENGAGKSTLSKIINGLYMPNNGTVYINDMPRDKYALSSILIQGTAVFQDYQRYKMTLETNIQISDLCHQKDDKKMTLSMQASELDIKDFKDGYQTVLSSEFGGNDISGGQWQRVAIARGLYRDHSYITLDEPTSSIDPLRESHLYNKFKSYAKDKLSIIVTHRIGAARIADTIIVLDKGIIAEIGSHDELIKKNGLYKKMFQEQAKWYE